MMYKDTAMKIINADMTDTMIPMTTTIQLVSKIVIDMEMFGQMVDTKINGHPMLTIIRIPR